MKNALLGLFRPSFTCPICDYHGPFKDRTPSTGRRKHARCPSCRSLERERLQYLVMRELELSGRLLHVAPDLRLREWFEGAFDYESADLNLTDVDHRADLTALPFPDASYDVVYASHVLEHIRDDHAALAEIRRILRPGGVAILPVPIIGPQTIEYPEPNPHESGHVRAPGWDYFERYERHFARVDLYRSEDFPEAYQLYTYEDRTRYPTPESPLRVPVIGDRHADAVPVCYR